MIRFDHLCCFERVGQSFEYCKDKHKRKYAKIDKDFILDTKRDGFYPKNKLKSKLWNKWDWDIKTHR